MMPQGRKWHTRKGRMAFAATLFGAPNVAMTLAELLLKQPTAILEQWKLNVSGSLHPEAMPHWELVDHLPAFLTEIAEALQDRDAREDSSVAAEHGVFRCSIEAGDGDVQRV